jgi:hypothetical protein
MPLTFQFQTHEAASEVYFFLGNKSTEQDTINGSILNVAFVIKNVSPPQPNQKLERAFTTPKVAPHSELH